MAALERLDPGHLRSVVMGYRDALRAHQERLNRLNVYPVPDGDTGTNMALTLESVVAELGGAEDMAGVCRAISHGSLMGARGNSGVILSQVLRGLTDRLKDQVEVDGAALADGLAAASAAAYQAVMKPVEGTILTVVREAGDAAQAAARRSGATLVTVLEGAAAGARAALERTPELLPVLAEAGVVDAGGAGFVLLVDVLLQVADGRPVPTPDDLPAAQQADLARGQRPPAGQGAPVAEEGGVGTPPGRTSMAPAGQGAPAVAEEGGVESPGQTSTSPQYEVMFLLEAPDEQLPAFKEAWSTLGDSIVVVGGDGLWNCHIHSDDIGACIEAGINVGRPRKIRVTDLAEQVEEERWVRQGTEVATAPPVPAQDTPEPTDERHVATGVVAVGAGEGVAHVFRSLGAQEVVAGGQSANPSTAELLAAVEAIDAEKVLILPNNKNVIPVAEQVSALAGKPVRVVRTTGIVEGVAALLAYDREADGDANAEAMTKAVAEVVSGEVTWAVRDATCPAGPVTEGDYLGLSGGEILAVNADLPATACELLDRLVEERHELVTVIEGQRSSEAATEHIRSWLGTHRPNVEVEVQSWGQPLAAYLFSIE